MGKGDKDKSDKDKGGKRGDPALPFDGAISRFAAKEAPKDVREALKDADKHDILDPRYPYQARLDDDDYEAAFKACQLELIKMQTWVRAEGKRLVVVFEGRDAAGKGGTIKAFTENLNPRSARVVALSAPSDKERGQWYFQRYVAHLPTVGEAVFFDRSWYNRAVVEHVFGWCTPAERERFFIQLPEFEDMLVRDGIVLIKVWLAIGRAEQLRQFLQRERDPLKQWKLSRTDIDGLARWDDYTAAIAEMFRRSHLPTLPWTVIWGEDKRRARLAAMQSVLGSLDYPGREIVAPDPAICGGPEILPG
jgi:polyphosphate kinase